MRTIVMIAIAALLFGVPDTQAAERAKSQGQIDGARSALNDFKSKAGDNKIVAADVTAAEQNLDKAVAAQKAGEKMFGGLTDEAEANVRHQTVLMDLNLKVAASKLEKARIESESAVLAKKIDAVQAKVKIFDDYRAEIARLKGELTASAKGDKELEMIRKEKSALEDQVARQAQEIAQLESVRADNKRLKDQLEKLQGELKKIQIVPAPAVLPARPESFKPVSRIDAPLPKAVSESGVKTLPLQEKRPAIESPADAAVKPEETAAPLIVPAPEKQ